MRSRCSQICDDSKSRGRLARTILLLNKSFLILSKKKIRDGVLIEQSDNVLIRSNSDIVMIALVELFINNVK